VISRLFYFVFLLHCVLVVFTTDLHAQNIGIWITGPIEKVLQTSTTPGSAQSLQIYASRNEFADFRVPAISTTNPIQRNVTVSDFTNAQAYYAIHSSTNVFLCREAYLNIRRRGLAYKRCRDELQSRCRRRRNILDDDGPTLGEPNSQ
jgi:hypothetical protein